MIDKTETTVQKFGMLKSNDRIIVAVSGGPDSVALVHILNKLKRKWHLYLHIAHLNHLLRKEEADEERIFVEKLAKKLNLPLSCEEIDVKNFASKKKISVEEAARKVRYDFLLRVAKNNSASKIALGHNQDDQAETVLMRFLRGSGISGLRGIHPTRKLNGCLIIRPLIETKREQIKYFLSIRNISFCIDSSNLKNLYFRNRIRNELMPLLEERFNPNIKEILVNFAENASCDFNFLEKISQNKFRSVRELSNDAEIVINLRKFSHLHKALQKQVVRLAIKELKDNVRQIDFRHWKELDNLVEKRPKGSIVDLPGDISVLKRSERISFYKRVKKK